MKYLLLLSITSMNFFIIVSTFSKETLNINIDEYYYIIMIALNVFVFLYIFNKTLMIRSINVNYFYLLVLALIIVIGYLISPFNYNELAKNNFLFYLLWAIPASICGIEIHNFKKSTVDNFFRIILLIFTLCLLFVILIPYINGSLPNYINFGLLNYQNVSYIAAFIFGLGLYFFTEKSTNYKFTYLLCSFLMVPIIFIASGRGGAVLLILYILITTLGIIKDKSTPIINRIVLGTLILILVTSITVIAISLDEEGRTFSYISSEGISLDQTSGRGDLYNIDLHYIKQNPIIGYGLFNYYHLIGTIPHNIILELLLICGFIGTFVVVIIFSKLIIKYIKYYNNKTKDRIVGFLFLYPMTLLMFSSNLLVVSEFWFVIFYFIAKPKEKKYEET